MGFLSKLFQRPPNKDVLLAKIDYCIRVGGQPYAEKNLGSGWRNMEDPELWELALREMMEYLRSHRRPQIELELYQLEKRIKNKT